VFVVLETQLEPKLVNRRQFSPILTILVMIAMADAFGVAGLLAAPPLAAAIQIFFAELVAPPAVAARLAAPAVQYTDLQQRLASVEQTASDSEVATEAANLLARLQHLMADAREVLDSPAASDSPAGFARRMAAADKAAGGPG
jgi:hypothetical protein